MKKIIISFIVLLLCMITFIFASSTNLFACNIKGNSKLYKKKPHSNNPVTISLPALSPSPESEIDLYKQIHLAILNNDMVLLSDLIKKCTDLNKIVSNNIQATPIFHSASLNKNYEAMTMMLENGIDIDVKDVTGSTALLYAVYDGESELVKFLLDNGANPNVSNCMNESILYFSIRFFHEDIAELLVKNGADIVGEWDKLYEQVDGITEDNEYYDIYNDNVEYLQALKKRLLAAKAFLLKYKPVEDIEN